MRHAGGLAERARKSNELGLGLAIFRGSNGGTLREEVTMVAGGCDCSGAAGGRDCSGAAGERNGKDEERRRRWVSPSSHMMDCHSCPQRASEE